MLQRRVFAEHLSRLEKSIAPLAGEKLLTSYHAARNDAFALEFFGKFYHKQKRRRAFTELIESAKDLEDRLGKLDEVDAMIPFAREFAPGTVETFTRWRDENLAELRAWLREHGWTNGRALKRLRGLGAEIEWLDDDENRTFAAARLRKSLLNLQEDCDDRKFDARKHGYRFKDVEPRVHKLRREIRKQLQFMSYVGGVFTLDDSRPHPFYRELLSSRLAQGPFSRLPRPRLSAPLPVPRDLFLALNRFTEELGNAKDWAYQLGRLREAGCAGRIDFDQLDVRLKNWRGEPVPFNDLVRGLLAEIRRRRPFARMAARLQELE